MFNLNKNTYQMLFFLAVLMILGIISFSAYMYVSGQRKFGIGVGMNMEINPMSIYT